MPQSCALRLLAAAAVLLRGAGAASTSAPCRASLEAMVNDTSYQNMNNSLIRWCRLRLENTMANCCELADFVTGRGEGCVDCMADCKHRHFEALCTKSFGKACTVQRFPFPEAAPQLELQESFCVPEACNNAVDKEALLAFYHSQFEDLRVGWHKDYNKGTLTCPSNALEVTIAVILSIIAVCAAGPIAFILFCAPRERGKTLVTQADMQGADLAQDGTMNNWGFGGHSQALREAAGGQAAPDGDY